MPATVHVVLLLIVPLAGILCIALLKRRKPTDRQWTVAAIVALLGMAISFATNQHSCREGQPRNQWLILAGPLFLALALVHSPLWRRLIGAALLIGMLGLSFHFTEIVHTPGWTGNPAWDGAASDVLEAQRQFAKSVIDDTPELAETNFPAGWLRDLPVWSKFEHTLGKEHPKRREVSPVWHSWLTGLYQYASIPQDFWYPGGPLRATAERIELRDRPDHD